MRYLLVMLLSISMAGCSFISLGGGGSTPYESSPKAVKEKVSDLHLVAPPSKSSEHKENEKRALALAKTKVSEANDISTESPVKSNLRVASKLLNALQRSIGTPTKEVTDSIDQVEEVIRGLDDENEELREKRVEYEKLMDENRQTIAQLQGLLDVRMEREKSLLDRVTWWITVAIILSIAIAIFVPGGMFIVKRFWSKAAEVGISAAKSAAHAGSQLSSAISKHMETADEEERKRLQNSLNAMDAEAKDFWRKSRIGKNPAHEAISKLHPTVLKKSGIIEE